MGECLFIAVSVVIGLCVAATAASALETGTMGGVAVPGNDALKAMHKGEYILHARGGKLTRVEAEKALLPGKAGEEGGALAMARDGTIYVARKTIVCKSTDGGRTWKSYKHGPEMKGIYANYFQILRDGTFIVATQDRDDGKYQVDSHLDVWASNDEGRTWRSISKIKLPRERFRGYTTFGLFLLPDGTLLCRTKLYGIEATRKDTLLLYRSSDGGKSWQGPRKLADWSSEGGMVLTPSGKILATLRYQRKLLAGDPPGQDSRGYKHVFLADSLDKGLTWTAPRPLTTVYGQCHSFPVVLGDGTTVVIHDTRYGPGHRGSRAVVSYDEGKTWADEVYYMSYTEDRAEPSASVVLKDGTVLTIIGADKVWQGPIDLTAIRWRPVKK